jgi:hypothetical protein
MKPGRAPDVTRTGNALAVLEVTVIVTTLGIGDDVVTETVVCPRAVVEQLELARAVVAGSGVVVEHVDFGSAAVASTASMLEQVVSKTSSLAETSVSRFQ